MFPWAGYSRRIASPAAIDYWARERPGHNLAVVTGELSGVIVIDVDPGAPDDWQEGPLDSGCVVETPRGGRHYYFAWQPGMRNSAGVAAKHVDVRADGGYVLCPPSVVDGKAYKIVSGGLETARDVPLPEWLAKRLKLGRRGGTVLFLRRVSLPRRWRWRGRWGQARSR